MDMTKSLNNGSNIGPMASKNMIPQSGTSWKTRFAVLAAVV